LGNPGEIMTGAGFFRFSIAFIFRQP